MYYIGVRDGKKEISAILISVPTLKVYRKFQEAGSHRSREIVTENLLGEKEKWINKGNDKQEEADSLVHNTTCVPKTNFKILNTVVPEKSLTQISKSFTLDRRKNGKRKQKLITASWFSFPQYTWPLSMRIQNVKTLALIGAENSVTKFFIGEKENGTNKGNDKHEEEADYLLHKTTTSHTHYLYQIFPRCSSSWEIFDRKKLKHKQTYRIMGYFCVAKFSLRGFVSKTWGLIFADFNFLGQQCPWKIMLVLFCEKRRVDGTTLTFPRQINCAERISGQSIWNRGNKRYLPSDRQRNKKNIFTFRRLNKMTVQNKTMKCLSCLLVTWTQKLCHTIHFAIKQLVVYYECNINANILFNKETKTITCMSNTTTKEN